LGACSNRNISCHVYRIIGCWQAGQSGISGPIVSDAVTMTWVQVRLSTTTDAAWKEWEAAVLALGAVAEGCISGLLPHLSQVPSS